ncbi:MAG: CcmD family protein [Desulfovibrionaceae bacterium]|nr:CcmD family protein [Desulfovibrionaceae bacterium]
MDAINWVIAANAAVWIGLGLYTIALSLKLTKLSSRLRGLQKKQTEPSK